MKKILQYFTIVFLTIFSIDLIIFLFAPSVIQKFSIFYLNDERLLLNKGFPKNYFINDIDRGFDISKSPGIFKMKIPTEISNTYNGYANSLGCNDQEKKTNRNKIIYLAGDSFTWGFVPTKKRFSNILSNELKKFDVYNCGVPHTGQFHQFSKFLQIFRNLKNLDIVIINIFENDIENDFFYPHSEVLNGYLIDNKDWCLNNNEIKIFKKSSDDLKKNFNNSNLKNYIISKIARNSATSNILYYGYKSFYNTVVIKNFTSFQCPKLSSNIYEYSNFNQKLMDDFLKKYKFKLQKWINHSKENDYEIIFSIISKKNTQRKELQIIFDYIQRQNIKVFKFDDYISEANIIKKNLYWKYDIHLNIEGHKEYATYLKKAINDY